MSPRLNLRLGPVLVIPDDIVLNNDIRNDSILPSLSTCSCSIQEMDTQITAIANAKYMGKATRNQC